MKMYYKKIGFVVALGVLATFSGCLNGSSSDVTPPATVSGLAFFHSAPGSPNLNVLMDGTTLSTSTFVYSAFSGYVAVPPGTHGVRFTSSANQSVQLDTTVNVVADKSYSFFLYNKGSKMKSFVSLDEGPAFASSNSVMVRVVHLSPDLPEVKVVLVGESKALSEQIDYTELTLFTEYAAKSSTIEVRSLIDNHVIATQTFDPEPHQFLTVALIGYVTPPAGNVNKLAVKVIIN
jgi:hypothetical protein